MRIVREQRAPVLQMRHLVFFFTLLVGHGRAVEVTHHWIHARRGQHLVEQESRNLPVDCTVSDVDRLSVVQEKPCWPRRRNPVGTAQRLDHAGGRHCHVGMEKGTSLREIIAITAEVGRVHASRNGAQFRTHVVAAEPSARRPRQEPQSFELGR